MRVGEMKCVTASRASGGCLMGRLPRSAERGGRGASERLLRGDAEPTWEAAPEPEKGSRACQELGKQNREKGEGGILSG